MDDDDDPNDEMWAPKGLGGSDYEVLQLRSTSRASLTLPSDELLPKQKTVLPTSDEHHTKVLASLVPDEIIYNVDDYSIRSYESCLLFGDVSGFTDLCEKYNQTGRGGPSRLTQVLNSYIGSMVLEIMSHGGDVLKFSGDAFLAMWKSGANESMQDVVHEALDCALMIQKTYGTYETDVGVFLRVKLAISAGSVKFSLIGQETNSHYVVVGKPIWDVKAAEHISSAGEIMVSITAWKYINPVEYKHEKMPGGLNVKVVGCGANWRSSRRATLQMQPEESPAGEDSESRISAASEETDRPEQEENEEFLIRPAVNTAARLKLKEALRRFIIKPVMRGIDLQEPLEYLTEMRKIVILFINVVSQKMDMTASIGLVDTAYKAVCSVVDKMEGCVNKVSLFDKDLMFVVIFGLRGFKHEMESQIGLKCATKCYKAITIIPGVVTVSVAVTTGNTYCGVVGHTLRREYTVISLTVNKAARLMVAYPNKVTCDRETFLHSKLQAKHFILQEYKPLKGIINPGPCYEFRDEVPSDVEGRHETVHPCPILGRDYEVNMYLHIGKQFYEERRRKMSIAPKFPDTGEGEPASNHYNTFVVYSEPRQGRTRLVQELVYVTPGSIPVNRISLTQADKKRPYHAIKMIFALPLDMIEHSTRQSRETKLAKRLKKVNVPDLHCCLNPVFNVNFETSKLYMGLSKHMKKLVLRKMIKQLCYGTFIKMWVVILDDGESIDAHSWPIIEEIINTDIIFMVITIETGHELPQSAEPCLQHKFIRSTELMGIDKWYHAGLACQILGVRGIPADLEKVIQTRSNGNAGWVESYLVSLIQAGGLLIRDVSEPDLHEYALVLPPLRMLVRKLGAARLPNENPMDMWEMYNTSYKESITNLFDEQRQIVRVIRICTINQNFEIDDVDPELTLDVVMLKTFDSLTSYEQLLLKCSAVIGEVFPRDMLLYIMSATSPRLTAVAVQKLFQIRVLACAKGDFSEGDTSTVFNQRLVNPNRDLAVSCECRGLTLLEGCSDLPKYASCGLMRFRLPKFRETTYNLLTDKQKKEFHSRAMRYLEKETRRCRTCGFGYFGRILGGQHHENLHRKVKKKKVFNELEQSPSEMYLIRSTRSTMKLSIQEARVSEVGSIISGKIDRQLVSSGIFGFQTIYRTRRNASITRTFSSADFSMCQCPLILNTMYIQMLEHCKGAGLMEKMMDVLLEYADVCITFCNIPEAMKILEEALASVETLSYEHEESELVWRIPLQCGKIYTLIGHSQFQLGLINEAYYCFFKAMKLYKYPFPKSMRAIKFKKFWKELKQNIGLFLFPAILEKTMEGYCADFCDNLAECLTLMCNLFIEVGMWVDAELAAVWALNKSLESGQNFSGMCMAYANMLVVMHYIGKQTVCVALEVHVLRFLHRKKSNIELEEMRAVAKLYGAIFASRILRAETDHALHIGYVMLRMCANVHAVSLSLRVFPLMFQGLIMVRRVMEAAMILQELEYYSDEDTDSSGKMWFYTLCVVLQLETGYCLIPFRQCEQFFQMEGETLITVRDPDAERRFFTVMWLWCIRMEEWEAASIWYASVIEYPNVSPADSMATIFTSLYYLEGLILMLVCKLDSRNTRAVARAYEDIGVLLKSLEFIAKTVKVILPRLYHLKAYFNLVRYNDVRSFAILKKAKKYAEKQGNVLEQAWIAHSEKAWTNTLAIILEDYWRERCDPSNLLDYHEVETNGGKLVMFTLPVPLYI